MRNDSKNNLAAVLAAAALLAAFIWISLRDDPMLSETPTPAADEEPSPDSETVELDTGPYKFERWEDAANHLAELIGLEYDALIAAGMDPLKAEMQAYHDVQDRIFFDKDKEDPALYAALLQYLPYHDDVPMEKRTRDAIPLEEYGSTEFLVRAGRLPPSALEAGSLSLPSRLRALLLRQGR